MNHQVGISEADVVKFFEDRIAKIKSEIDSLASRLRKYEAALRHVKTEKAHQKGLFKPLAAEIGEFAGLKPQEAVERLFEKNPKKTFTAESVREELLAGGFEPNVKTFNSVIHSALGRLVRKGVLCRDKNKQRLLTPRRGRNEVAVYFYAGETEGAASM